METSEQKKKLYYIFNGRFPSEKAHALYVVKSCEAFSELGYDVTVVAPARRLKSAVSYEEFFGVSKTFDVVYLPTIDLYAFKGLTKVAFLLSSFLFTAGVLLFFLFKNAKTTVMFSHDTSTTLTLCLLGKNVFYEMHDYPEQHKGLFRFLFKNVRGVITQNKWKKNKLIEEFGLNGEKISVEHNAVDIEAFSKALSKEDARKQLGLPLNQFIVLYTGHLFDWKGADILAKSAQYLDDTTSVLFIGGSEHDVIAFKNTYGASQQIQVLGYKPHTEIPLWQKASDCLILPNTATQDISKYYTSPMKLFEYMASERPIVASDLPSIRSVVGDLAVTFVEPDNPEALGKMLVEVKRNPEKFVAKTLHARTQVELYTWKNRAKRIVSFVQNN